MKTLNVGQLVKFGKKGHHFIVEANEAVLMFEGGNPVPHILLKSFVRPWEKQNVWGKSINEIIVLKRV